MNNQIFKIKTNDYSKETIRQRVDILEEHCRCKLDHIANFTVDSELARGKIERIIGFTQVPIGLIGPLKINGEYARGDFYVPLSTLEGALISSYNRGAKIISLAGGVNVVATQDQIQRAPFFVLQDINTAKKFLNWLEENFIQLKQIAESTTKFGKLHSFQPFLIGNTVYVRFEFYTGDAMGMNMITKATLAICQYIQKHFPIEKYVIESNMAVDKKPSFINMIMGRGKSVSAEILISERIVQKYLKTSPQNIVDTYHRQMLGNTLSGVLGCNYHFANGIAAIFLACGQDLANISESMTGIINIDMQGNDLYISISLPSLIVATVGGGVSMPTQKECLEIMDCYGAGKAKRFAEIVAATLLAGEISLAGSIAAGDFVAAHEKYGRNRPTHSLE